ncbi:hypothetical protein FRC01_006877 [Tulasnella sp. 417]|nr:hypothetical protein FRC01_006877 [Tulasnella sp. 417]
MEILHKLSHDLYYVTTFVHQQVHSPTNAPKAKHRSDTVSRAKPPNLRKRCKVSSDPGTVTIWMDLMGETSGSRGPSSFQAGGPPCRLPVVVAPDNEWIPHQSQRLEGNVFIADDSPELDLSQPPEPDHLVSELLDVLLAGGGVQSGSRAIDDEVVYSVLNKVQGNEGDDGGPAEGDTQEDETPTTDGDPHVPQYLRSGYLNEMYASDYLAPNSPCAGWSCRIQAKLRSDSGSIPSDGAPSDSAQAAAAQFRCRDCIGGRVFCKDCIVSIHDTMPFHRVEEWNGLFFKPQSPVAPQVHQLMDLGHGGSKCDVPYLAVNSRRPVTSTLTVLHINGYHKLQVCYCRCVGSPEPFQQLLQAGLFPATHARPETAFTFQLLKHFQRFNLASKTAAYDYHKALLHLTDNVLPQSIPSSYRAFVYVIRQWRVLTMLKRSGKQHLVDPEAGELALRCPACPRPGVNLPDGWEDHPQRRLLYGQFLSGDGNFHLVRRKNNAGTGKDAVAALQRRASMLGDAGFWVPTANFESYLQASKGVVEQRALTECNTVAGNPLKGSNATTGKNEVTGAFAMSCRHVCFCPSGVCDFSRGEGYRYVDVPMAMVIQQAIDAGLKDLVISYDIACKYSINFLERVCNSPYALLPDNLQSLVSILWMVGKFHLGGHHEECQKFFNFNYMEGVGRMSGELVETIWSYFDFLKYQTHEMGPGSWKEMLSDAMNYWNWQKIVKMSDATRLAILRANVQCENAAQRLKDIEENLGPEVVQKLALASAQAGPDKYLPSKSKIQYPSQKEVLAALRKDEELAASVNCWDRTVDSQAIPRRASGLQEAEGSGTLLSPSSPRSPPAAPNIWGDSFTMLDPQSSPLAHWHRQPPTPEDDSDAYESEGIDRDGSMSGVESVLNTPGRRKRRRRMADNGTPEEGPARASTWAGPVCHHADAVMRTGDPSGQI